MAAALLFAGSLPDFRTVMHGAAFVASVQEEADQPADNHCGENLTWSLSEDGELTISGTGEMDDYRSDILTSVPWEDQRERITRITIGDQVTSIGKYAFMGCTALRNIKVPGNVREINRGAFYQCTSLLTANMAEGVETISASAFRDCTALRAVGIPESVTLIGWAAFGNTPWLASRQKESPLVIINNMLIDGTTAKGVVRVPDGVTCIGFSAFEANCDITSVYIPNSVTEIYSNAFENCPYLETVRLPQHIQAIYPYAFAECSDLKKISIPDEVEIIADHAFLRCIELAEVKFPKSLKTIEESAFENCESLEEAEIPDSVEELYQRAFYECIRLSRVHLPDSLTYIEEQVFRETAWLDHTLLSTPMLIQNGLLIKGGSSTCYEEVTVPDGVHTIVKEAFMNCDNMTVITLPESVTEIQECAFANCGVLSEIRIMNPECRIEGRDSTVYNSYTTYPDRTELYYYGVICSYWESTAHTFADTYNYQFISLDLPPGDCSGDHMLSIADAVLLARFAAEDATLTAAQISGILACNPDTDRDGGITISDVIALLKGLAKS
jgi:hypothetical protein